MIPSSLIAPVALKARDPSSCHFSANATIAASSFSSNFSPFLAALALLTIDITPAICFGPITAIFAVGHKKVKALSNALPDIA